MHKIHDYFNLRASRVRLPHIKPFNARFSRLSFHRANKQGQQTKRRQQRGTQSPRKRSRSSRTGHRGPARARSKTACAGSK